MELGRFLGKSTLVDAHTLLGKADWLSVRKKRACQTATDWLELTRHHHSEETCVKSVSVRFELLQQNNIAISYAAEGDLHNVAIPPRRNGVRRDNLWRTTCFEFFAAFDNDPTYWEFNFSPSTDWSAYRFSNYRRGRHDEKRAAIEKLLLGKTGEQLNMGVRLSLDSLKWRSLRMACFGFSAIFEDKSGRQSYWALQHPQGNPDFHHRISFSHKPHQG